MKKNKSTPQLKVTFLFACVLTLCFFNKEVKAQQISNINMDSIQLAVANPESDYYYPTLLKRLKDLDTTLNLKEYRHLYYGNVFEKSYHPYGSSKLRKDFLEAYDIYSQQPQELKGVVKQGDEVLLENPVDLEVLLKMAIAHLVIGEDKKAKVYGKIYYSFLDVIYSSGNGRSAESAWVVTSVDDEYRIVGDLGLRVMDQSLIGECDRLLFSKKGQKRKTMIKELYFNVRLPLTHLSKSYDKSPLPDPDKKVDQD
ncbi:MAG: DUF4919 domain-containing protein [Flavobacteriales bacterium]|nr:DUF4919 domain-containing protein [Flavobacteriales bacterium]